MSLRASFFAVPAEIPFEEVSLPAGKVRVYGLSAGEKDAFDLAHAHANGEDFRARLVVATARDESGQPVFSPGDLAALSARPVAQLEPLVEAAIRVNRLSDRDVEAVRKN